MKCDKCPTRKMCFYYYTYVKCKKMLYEAKKGINCCPYMPSTQKGGKRS